jgi:exopolyphosphatase / guanosine-5'-triphosphate,3'-diphosphate pyrophosphatase
MGRYAAIDVGTNSVLLLVAEQDARGRFAAVAEQAEITRLGRGVDSTRALAPQAIEETLAVVERFVALARAQGAQGVVISATSAARDASNGATFLALARERVGLPLEILTGDEEARLSFASAFADFGGAGPLAMVDIGGGSTEVVLGDAHGDILFRRSFDVGSVRLTERLLRDDPPSSQELGAVRSAIRKALKELPASPPGTALVGIAGTVTTLFAVNAGLATWDPEKVHGLMLSRAEVDTTVARLVALPVAKRRLVPGLQPKRADVIVAGGLILQGVLKALDLDRLRVSDRGLRWGLLADRFGGAR